MRQWWRLFPVSVWLVLVGCVLWVGVITYLRARGVLTNATFLYIVQPLGMLSLAGVSWALARGKSVHLRRQREKLAIVLSAMALWAIIYFLSGLATTYTYNPLMGNGASVFLAILGYGVVGVLVEYSRWRLVCAAGRTHPLAKGIVIAAVFSLLQINLVVFITTQPGTTLESLMAVVVPIVAHNVVVTYLAYVAGFGAMLVYRLGWEVLISFLPVVPRYDWYMTGTAAIAVGIVMIMLLDRTRQDRRRPLRFRQQHHRWVSEVASWTVLAGLMLFMTGVFSYRPVAIVSNSMQPIYSRGDMVIVERLSGTMDIKVGDILHYVHDNRTITHRVVAIEEEQGQPEYRAQGDNSQSPDPWAITRDDILGIVRARIPLIGYPTVVLNELIQQ